MIMAGTTDTLHEAALARLWAAVGSMDWVSGRAQDYDAANQYVVMAVAGLGTIVANAAVVIATAIMEATDE